MKKFFDNASTTKPKKSVIDLAIDIMNNEWKNPSSLYDNGKFLKGEIDYIREKIAKAINAEKDEIIFCPSASAANTLAISGYINANHINNFYISNYEHDSINLIDIEGVNKNYIKSDKDGLINSDNIVCNINELVSVCGVNSEIGVVNNIPLIASVVHLYGGVIHSDLTQYAPYRKIDVKAMHLDMATFSGHKFGALRGCAILYVKRGIKLFPLIFGHQENGLIGGTENYLAIKCFEKAFNEIDYDSINNFDNMNYLLFKLKKSNIKFEINGNKENCMDIPILNIYCKDLYFSTQRTVYMLDKEGFEISSGSACNSYVLEPSKTLMALYNDEYRANHSIRISLSSDTTREDIDIFVDKLSDLVKTSNIFKR